MSEIVLKNLMLLKNKFVNFNQILRLFAQSDKSHKLEQNSENLLKLKEVILSLTWEGPNTLKKTQSLFLLA